LVANPPLAPLDVGPLPPMLPAPPVNMPPPTERPPPPSASEVPPWFPVRPAALCVPVLDEPPVFVFPELPPWPFCPESDAFISSLRSRFSAVQPINPKFNNQLILATDRKHKVMSLELCIGFDLGEKVGGVTRSIRIVTLRLPGLGQHRERMQTPSGRQRVWDAP